MTAFPFVAGALCVMALAYRYYYAFIAARVACLDADRPTPAHTRNDGQNFHPTNKYVLFGHHFAAITGAGPLIGPVLAAQFGFLPGYLWILIGVVLGGAVHDFVILAASVRHAGKSLAEIAREELSPLSGIVASVAVLFVVVVALAVLGLVVVNALKDSPWGVFAIGLSIPAALYTGLHMYRLRPGRIVEASAIGVTVLALGVVGGRWVAGSALGAALTLDDQQLAAALGVYGFVASVLPVWLLLCPRDYLSAYMKLGTILFLTVGVLVVNPEIHMPMTTEWVAGGGPIVPGKLFPFVFITIACGAVSGFHSLVASGTTPKMLSRETDARMIGFGAMLCEGFIAITSLVAACALYPADYFAINTPPAAFANLGMETVNLDELARQVGETLEGRAGGAVSLAVGMAQIFSALPGMSGLMDIWYHFAIMFEALFILTTIDTGTRVARFLLQEVAGKVHAPLGRHDWLPGAVASTALVVLGWWYFISTGSIRTLWPMFGVANQLLAVVALTVGTTWIVNQGRARYAWVTGVPLAFVATTTLTAGWLNVTDVYWRAAGDDPTKRFQAGLNTALTAVMMAAVVIILADAARRWVRRRPPAQSAAAAA